MQPTLKETRSIKKIKDQKPVRKTKKVNKYIRYRIPISKTQNTWFLKLEHHVRF